MRRYPLAPILLCTLFFLPGPGCITSPDGKRTVDLNRLENESAALAADLRDISEALGASESDEKIRKYLKATAGALDGVVAAIAAHRATGGDTADLLAALQIAADAAARIVGEAEGDEYKTARLAATGAKILLRRIRSAVG